MEDIYERAQLRPGDSPPLPPLAGDGGPLVSEPVLEVADEPMDTGAIPEGWRDPDGDLDLSGGLR